MERCNLLALVHHARREEREYARANPNYIQRRDVEIIAQCRAHGGRYDFAAWTDDNLMHFFVQNYISSRQGDNIAALMFDGCDLAHREDEDAEDDVGGRQPTSGGEGPEDESRGVAVLAPVHGYKLVPSQET